MAVRLEQYAPECSAANAGRGAPLSFASASEFQHYLLQGVSRTFALTIPQLPPALREVVVNAYLLCRIIDTIEDEPALSPAQKRYFGEQFIAVVADAQPAETFPLELAPLLSAATLPAEQELIRYVPSVMDITRTFSEPQRATLQRCIRVMATGMIEFQEARPAHGLTNLAGLDRYCYYVAGIVGETLTTLFCDYSPLIARQREPLMTLAVSFGQGLQMTNILKDIWDDQTRGACWLPRDIFTEVGFDLQDLAVGERRDDFEQGLGLLVGIAHGHLKNALAYTLLLPRSETGIRQFCLWAIGMAVLTLRKINQRRDFTCGQQVKISRRSVRATILASRLTVRHNRMLKSLFHLAARRLPLAP